MSDTDSAGIPSQEEVMAALFAGMVMQQTNMALMLLGKMPHPQSGETMRDLESAQMFIDQLEMLGVKTRGNLSKQEDALLRESLTAVRMAFVEAVQSAPGREPAPAAEGTPAPGEAPAGGAAEADSRRKFSKKY